MLVESHIRKGLQVLAQAYSKSLLLYFGVPLLAADLLKPAQVEAWEKEALL